MRFFIFCFTGYMLFVFGCNSSTQSGILTDQLTRSFIDTVRLLSHRSAKTIDLDTLNAEHFPAIPLAFFRKYYAKYIITNEIDFSVAPSDNVYWHFSFLDFEQGSHYDYQKIIGYDEKSGTSIYLVTLHNKTHQPLSIDKLAYTEGDGGYFENSVLTTIRPGLYSNQHTEGETDEGTLLSDSIQVNKIIYDLAFVAQKNGKLEVDTLSSRKVVEVSYNDPN